MEDLCGKQLGQYRVVAPLGKGGMATVYKAYQPSIERYVALKILPRYYADDPNFIGRFRQEAKVIASLEHLNILPVHDYGEAEGYTYLVMRYVEGGTLAGLLRGQPMPLVQICRIVSQLASALDYAHLRGVVHRDVKPSNVLLDEQGNCLLSDFGIARMVEASTRFTATGSFVGTPAYASPEQGLGRDLDGRSDIYSLGVMLYEMAVGRPPFEAETPMAIIVKHIHDPLPLPRAINPALSEAVERVILKALAKSPADRYQTADEMAEALAATLNGKAAPPVEATTAKPHSRSARQIPAWGWAVGGGLIILCVLAGLIGGINLLQLAGTRSTTTPTKPPLPTGFVIATTPTRIVSTKLSATTSIPSLTRTLAPTTSTARKWQTWAQGASFPAPESKPTNIVRVADQVWVSVQSGRFYRLTLDGSIMAEADLPPACRGHWAWDGQALWVASGNAIHQCDPETWQELSTFDVDMSEIYSLVWDGVTLRVIDREGNLGLYDRSGKQLRKLAVGVPGSAWPIAATWGADGLWVVYVHGQTSRYDQEFALAGSFEIIQCGPDWAPSELAVYWDGETLWVADPQQNRIFQCAPAD